MTKISEFHSINKNFDNSNNSKNITEEEIYQKYNQYKDLSQNELNSELFKEVTRQKANGTFDYKKLENMLESIKDMIGFENYQNMKKILESLK